MSAFVRRYILAALAGCAAGMALLFILPALVAGAMLSVMVVLLVYILSFNDAKLIAQMKAVLGKIESGLQPEPIVSNRKDELGALAEGINKLTNRDKAVQQANTDALTGLANRRGVMQKLEAAFKSRSQLALFYIDLDKFKPVNDQYGHEAGDAVLKRVAELFLACARDTDVVARLGGDEFIIIYMGLTDRAILEQRANKILEVINEPIWLGDIRVKLGASIGITVAPQDGSTVEALLNASDETMYAVKKAGRNGFKFYS